MWWIQSVYVDPDYRKQGLFKTLYAHVRAEAIKEGTCRRQHTLQCNLVFALNMRSEHCRCRWLETLC